MCGENSASSSLIFWILGSPPRVRGKRLVHLSSLLRHRITPACAGKTYWCGEMDEATEDHPRVCGENNESTEILSSSRGSPPRVRGKPTAVDCFNKSPRITPACAGKTLRSRIRHTRREDHPRVCGENRNHAVANLRYLGSPPRVRGKHAVSQRYRTKFRITPACAGKTVDIMADIAVQ